MAKNGTETLLLLLRQHGVSRYRAGADGSVEVEFFASLEPLAAAEAAMASAASTEPEPREGEKDTTPPSRLGLRRNDPLLDNVG